MSDGNESGTERWSYLLITFFTALFLGVNVKPFARSSNSPEPQLALKVKPESTAAKKDDAVAKKPYSAWKPLGVFLNEPNFDDPSFPSTSPQFKSYQCTAIVATVPDPYCTEFAHWFDSTVAAIEQALADNHYVLDNFVLPWPHDSAAASEFANVVPPWELYPGALLFRHLKEQQRLCVVFLVGESPTAGIAKPALAAAIDYSAQLQQFDSQLQPIRLLSPYFSGSLASLKAVLASNDDESRYFTIVAGAATGVDVDEFKRFGNVFSFRRTVLLQGALIQNIYDYIRDRDDHGKIAFLHEANTGFGVTLSTLTNKAIEKAIKEATEKAIKEAKDKAEKNDPGGQPPDEDEIARTIKKNSADDVLMLPFPLAVGSLRGQYDHERAIRHGGLPQPTAIGNRVAIPFNESLPFFAKEVQPFFKPMDDVNADLVLARIPSTISREQIRYVGLLATDVRDKIFLASQIRKFCPDVQLFTTASDLLFTHPDYNTDLKGMLIASTYPLFSRNQSWTHPLSVPKRRERLQFASQSDQGCYNATIALLDSGKSGRVRMDYGLPYPDLKSKQQGVQPVCWLSMVGNEELMPLHAIEDYTPDSDKYTPDSDKPLRRKDKSEAPIERLEFSLASVTVVVATCVFCLWRCVIALFAARAQAIEMILEGPSKPRENLKVPRVRSSGQLYRRRGDAYAKQQRWLICCEFGVLFVICSCLALICAIPLCQGLNGSWSDPSKEWVAAGLSLLATCAAALALLLLIEFPFARCFVAGANWFVQDRGENQATGVEVWRTTIALAGVIATVVLCLIVFMIFEFDKRISDVPGEAALFFLRVTDFENGLSPVVPTSIGLLMVWLWAHTHLKRLYEVDCLMIESPLPATVMHVAFSDEELRTLTQGPLHSLTWPQQFCVSGGIVLIGYAIWTRGLPTAELWPFDYLIFSLLTLVLSLIVLTLIEFRKLWKRLHALLVSIAQLPLDNAWKRVPAHVRSLVGGMFDSVRPRLSSFGAVLHHRLLIDLPSDEIAARQKKFLEESQQKNFLEESQPPDNDQRLSASKELIELGDESRHYAGQLAAAWMGDHTAFESSKDTSSRARQLREDFLVTYLILYLSQFMVLLRHYLTFITVASLAVLVAITAYPFQPRTLLLMTISSIILAALIVICLVVYGINTNEVFSRILKTEPDKLSFDRNLMATLVTYVAPLVVIMGFVIANAYTYLISALNPIFRALH
jgi:hypothetical protein